MIRDVGETKEEKEAGEYVKPKRRRVPDPLAGTEIAGNLARLRDQSLQ